MGIGFGHPGNSSGGFTNPANTDLSMGSNNITSSGGNSVWTVLPAGGSAAILTAMQAADAAGGGIVELMEGTYSISTQILDHGLANVSLIGKGWGTILEVASGAGFSTLAAFDVSGNSSQRNINNITAGGTSITYTTASDAAVVVAGDRIKLRGSDVNSEIDADYVIASADGNPGTGVVTLKYPIRKTLTSVEARNARGAENLVFKDFVIRQISGAACEGINLDASHNCHVDNVWFDAFTGTNMGGLTYVAAHDMHVNRCIFTNIHGYGIDCDDCTVGIVEECFFERCGLNGTGQLRTDYSAVDLTFRNNTLFNTPGIGIEINGTSSVTTRRIIIDGNKISRCAGVGIYASKSYDLVITNNTFDRIAGAYCISPENACRRFLISDNQFENSARGVRIDGVIDAQVSDNIIKSMTDQGLVCQNGCTNVVISNNIIGNTSDVGILLSDTDFTIVSGNIVRNGGNIGIQLTSGCDSVCVTGNLTNNCTGVGISLSDDCDNNVIVGNNVTGDGITTGLGTNNLFQGNVEGPNQLATRTVSGNVSTNAADQIIYVNTAAARTITLSTADCAEGRHIIIKDSTGGALANNITIDTQGSELIDGAASITIALNYDKRTLVSDGTNWYTV